MSDLSQSDFATISRSPILRTDVSIEGGVAPGDCPPGQECLPSDYIDPDDCPPGCGPGEACLPEDYIDPATCPECGDCCTETPRVKEAVWGNIEFGGDHVTVTFGATPDDGDLIVLGFYSFEGDVEPVVTWPSGFTVMQDPAVVWAPLDFDTYVTYAWKVASSEAGAAYQVDYVAEGANVAIGKVYTGADPVAPIGDTAPLVGTFGETELVLGDVTTTLANSLWEVWGTFGGSADPVALGAARYHYDQGTFFHNAFATFSSPVHAIGATGDLTVERGPDAGDPTFGAASIFAFVVNPECSCPSCDYRPYCLTASGDDVDTAILATSPFGYWKLDEASGTPQDSSGNGNHATGVVGSPTYHAGPIQTTVGESMLFANSGGFTRVTFPPASQMGDNDHYGAMLALVSIDGAGQDGDGNSPWRLFMGSGSGNHGLSFGFFDTSISGGWPTPGILAALYPVNNVGIYGTQTVIDETYPAGGNVHVFVLNSKFNAAEVWMDGVLVTVIGKATTVGENDDWYVGSDPNSFWGAPDIRVSNVAAWDAPLTNAQIKAMTEALLDAATLAAGWVPA